MADEANPGANLRQPPVDLRIILWLGLLVAAWLLLTPTTTTDGRSCGTPLFHLSEPGWDRPQLADATCVDRNRVRLDQAIVTTVGTLLVTGTTVLIRSLKDVGASSTSPRMRALTYREDQAAPTTRLEASATDPTDP